MAVSEGKAAPAFRLNDQNGQSVSLKSLRGRHLVLYFYPKDDTPGCTKEARGFRDLHRQFEKHQATIVGVSPDGADSHQAFIKKYRLPYSLLSDPDKKVMTKYSAFGEKMMYGKKTMGVIRSTVWIDPDGKVVRHWKRVPKAADHPQKVLEALTDGS